jgi:hypothetical protein
MISAASQCPQISASATTVMPLQGRSGSAPRVLPGAEDADVGRVRGADVVAGAADRWRKGSEPGTQHAVQAVGRDMPSRSSLIPAGAGTAVNLRATPSGHSSLFQPQAG